MVNIIIITSHDNVTHAGLYTALALGTSFLTVLGQNSIVNHYEILAQQTREVDPMLDKCWPTVYDAGPTLALHRINVSCLLRVYRIKNSTH